MSIAGWNLSISLRVASSVLFLVGSPVQSHRCFLVSLASLQSVSSPLVLLCPSNLGPFKDPGWLPGGSLLSLVWLKLPSPLSCPDVEVSWSVTFLENTIISNHHLLMVNKTGRPCLPERKDMSG